MRTDFSSDVIDLRDATDRFEELRTELEERHEAGQFASDFDDWISNARDNSDPIHAAFGDEGREVQADIEEFYRLRELLEELKGNGGDHQWEGDWYPLQLIHESHFTDHIEELINDCYEMPKAMQSGEWPYRHMSIDFEAAAAEAKHDYSSVELNGWTYLYR